MAPNDDDSSADDEKLLSPDELDITSDRRVVELDEARFLISSESEVAAEADSGEADPLGLADTPHETPTTPNTVDEFDERAVGRWLSERLAAVDAEYGFHIAATFQGSTYRQELFSNDVVTTFENLLVWYAQHAGDGTPVETALGILLLEATVSVKYPPATLDRLLAAFDLSESDSIADLQNAIATRGYLQIPPSESTASRFE